MSHFDPEILKIEQVLEKDLSHIKSIAQRAILESVDAPEALKNDIITDTFAHIEKGITAENACYLKYVSGEIVGFVLIQDYWNLSDLFVSPCAQGRGIGKALLNAAITECQLSSSKDYVRVNSSKNAEGFYRHLGFEPYEPKIQPPDFVVSLVYKFKAYK